MTDLSVRRVDFGYFIRPATETGTGSPRVEACLGYLVEHPGGLRVNCHLHFDHSGGNPGLPGRPIYTQRTELDLARTVEDHTLPCLIDSPGAEYVELDGEAEILPGVVIVPTPGHTAGHQSVVVRRSDGTVIVAGQSHDHADGFTGDVLARRAAADGAGEPVPLAPAWMDRLLSFDPARVLFAHDNAVWTP
jgi:N-acyl homoserine lactone hydrolase